MEPTTGPVYLSSALEAESHAMLEALHILQQRVFTSATIASDSLLTIQLLHGTSYA